MKAGRDGNRIAEEMLKQGLITADIDFAGEQFSHLKKGDIILIHKGAFPISIVEIISKIDEDKLSDKSFGIDYSIEILSEYNQLTEQEQIRIDLWGNCPPTGTFYKINSGNNTFNRINTWYNMITNKNEMKNIIDIIKYKKQIILQGPPGTGKTREAKLIAESICSNFKLDLSHKSSILELLYPNKTLKTMEGNVFTIEKITNTDTFQLKISTGSIHTVTINQLLKVDNEDNDNVGGKSYAAAMVKYVKSEIAYSQIKLIQFHPAYSYEDFVRGIVAKSTESYIEYKTENKILAEFAQKAYKNWAESEKDLTINSQEKWFKEELKKYHFKVNNQIDESGEYLLNNTKSYISKISDDRINYYNKNYNPYPKGFELTNEEFMRIFLKIPFDADYNNAELSTHQYKKLIIPLLQDFRKSIEIPEKFDETNSKVKLLNYVLIIDEINRANLPAVLGELIYALEYRGEKVESMYSINDDNSIIIPPNLYIIGTMNTSDRSVGQIDYAIRRRFAFIDILPKVLEGEKFELELFKKVSALFIQNFDEYIQNNTVELKLSEHLSEEFRPEDVWLGHSYFIKSEDNFLLRKKYEIIPILKEYVKDGILRNRKETIDYINKL